MTLRRMRKEPEEAQIETKSNEMKLNQSKMMMMMMGWVCFSC